MRLTALATFLIALALTGVAAAGGQIPSAKQEAAT